MTTSSRTPAFPVWGSILQSYGILLRNLPAVIAIYAPVLIAWAPLLLMKLWLTPETSATGNLVLLVCLVVVILGSIVASAALQYATLAYLDRGVFPAGDGYRLAVRRLFPLCGMFLIVGIGAGIAIGLLIVPFLILLPIFCLTTAVFISEGRGVFASFGRSAALTAGHRGRLLGVHLLSIVISVALAILIAIPQIVFAALNFVIGEAIMNMASTILVATHPLILATVLYRALRQPEAGVAPGRHNPAL